MCSIFSELTNYKVLFQTKHRDVFSVSLTSVLVYWGTAVSHAAASPPAARGRHSADSSALFRPVCCPLLLVLEAS